MWFTKNIVQVDHLSNIILEQLFIETTSRLQHFAKRVPLIDILDMEIHIDTVEDV